MAQVKISNLSDFSSYIVSEESECHDYTDRTSFNLAILFNDTITIGKTIAQIIVAR